MRIARGGGVFIVGALVPLLAAWPPLWPDSSMAPVLLAGIGTGLLMLFLWFFRDPERGPAAPLGYAAATAPADGRVLSIREEPEGCRIVVFLSLFDVHVTRSPLAGRVLSLRRAGGGGLPAFHRLAGGNARVVTEVQTADGAMTVTQITGLFTRRIVPYLSPGEDLARGARLGLIRFGSRVEVTLPAGYRSEVRVGDRIAAGRTVIALPAGEAAEAGRD